MSRKTALEYADSTFNPWLGCTKVSPGCDHCYAENLMDTTWHKVRWGAGQLRVKTSIGKWRSPLSWDQEHAAFFATHGRRQRVSCASLADVFDHEVDPEWRADLFRLIEATPHLDWLLLTKRIGNAAEMMRTARGGLASPPANVWLGATVVNQEEADRDVPKLLAVPARVRFLSVEPMLGRLDLEQACDIAERQQYGGKTWGEIGEPSRCIDAMRNGSVVLLDWVIVGGETGHKARPMRPTWVRSLAQQCIDAGVPFLFKSWGEWMPVDNLSVAAGNPGLMWAGVDESGAIWRQPLRRVGKKAAGRLLDGIEHNGFPT